MTVEPVVWFVFGSGHAQTSRCLASRPNGGPDRGLDFSDAGWLRIAWFAAPVGKDGPAAFSGLSLFHPPDRGCGSVPRPPTALARIMDILNQFFRDVFAQSDTFQAKPAGFREAQRDQLDEHLRKSRYGDFQLTDAVRPSLDVKIRPVQGYRHDVYVDEQSGAKVPVIMAAASREILFNVFMQLVQRLGPTVDVVLETSHNHDVHGHVDLYREQIDLPVVTSMLWEYENLLTNDGCTGIAVLNPRTPQEVQLDEHKLLIMYGSPLELFEHTLEQNGIHCDEEIRFLTEAEHVHSTTDHHVRHFSQLRTELGLEGDQQDRGEFESGC